MSSNRDRDALAAWISEQRGSGSLGKHQSAPELHLHQHTHPAPQSASDHHKLPHPLTAAMTMLMVSVALALPLTLIAVIIEAAKTPSVQYVQPSRGGW